MSKLNMKCFFIIFLLTQSYAFGGSGSSTPKSEEKAQENILKKQESSKKKMIQIIPIKINRKDKFLENQLNKMAIKHIIQTGEYELKLGDVSPRVTKNFDFENLDIRVKKGRTHSLELRIFELQRNTLVKKVANSGLKPETFLQEAEKMFEELFLDTRIQEAELKPE